jgi:hypothetical protein
MATHSPFTCQLCARAQKAKRGWIAHHGYAQPDGQGYRDGPCPGSRGRPYEHACDLIPPAVKTAQAALKGMRARLAQLRKEPPPLLTRTVEEKDKLPVTHRYPRPEGFTLKAKYEKDTPAAGYLQEYTGLLAHAERQISAKKQYIDFLTKRLAEWVPPAEPLDI